MEYKISLENLRIYAYHGVFEEERKTGNEFNLSLSVFLPYQEDILSDELNDTVSYADLYEIVKEEMDIPRNLLEKVAAEIVVRIKTKYSEITHGEIKIEKVHPPIPGMIGSASVTLYF